MEAGPRVAGLLVLGLLHLLGCSPEGLVPQADLGAAACSGDRPCALGSRCVAGACVPAAQACVSHLDCNGDQRCQAGTDGARVCVQRPPGSFNPECGGAPFRADTLREPVVACQWPEAGTRLPWDSVEMTPVVIDVDGDQRPEILFAGNEFVPGVGTRAHLIAIHGSDCSVLYDRESSLRPFSHLAAADLDGDGEVELIGLANTGPRLLLFAARSGEELASLTLPSDPAISSGLSGAAIADLDGDGQAEIIIGGTVVSWDKAQKALRLRFSAPTAVGSYGSLTTAADMDGDGRPELVASNRILDGTTGADRTPSRLAALMPGWSIVGDLDQDGAPDVVAMEVDITRQGSLAVVSVKDDRYLLPPMNLDSRWGGPPTLADFDGDGQPDIGVATKISYTVYSLACLGEPRPRRCQGPGVLWRARVMDASSSATGSSVFDFNGDGLPEVVYRDECWLRVYAGLDGAVLFARTITSGTATENALVADVNSDGHADLVVTSNDFSGGGALWCKDFNPEPSTSQPYGSDTTGVLVLRDPQNRWMPSRALWNQHTYHITNINDDGTVPRQETPNWTRYNNFRQNVQGRGAGAGLLADLTARAVVQIEQGDCQTQQRLSAQLCNRGSVLVQAGAPGTFYGPGALPGGLAPLCTARTRADLAPGLCETVSCDWLRPPSGAHDLVFRADDDGGAVVPVPQCRAARDFVLLPKLVCGGGGLQ